jgi:hypothetical protein
VLRCCYLAVTVLLQYHTYRELLVNEQPTLKVDKNENSFGFDFEFCTVLFLVMLKCEGFVTNNFLLAHYGGR